MSGSIAIDSLIFNIGLSTNILIIKARLQEGKMEIKIKSTAFEEGGMIPKKYTCDGIDISPPLAWASVPEGTKSFALICDDPDAPTRRTWIHWVIFNMPADTRELPENIPPQKTLTSGAKQGVKKPRGRATGHLKIKN